ncbi:MAG TPA: DUF4440 domain-containing protein [Chryseosolibacter sp.]
MKARLALLLASLSVWAFQSRGQGFSEADLLKTETDFNAMAQQLGFCYANKKYGAPDAVVFRPSKINLFDWISKLQDTTFATTWYPSLVRVSASNDLGYGTGPFQSRFSDGSVWHGQFFTLWSLQPDGTPKFIVDFGSNILPADKFVPEKQLEKASTRKRAVRVNNRISAEQAVKILEEELNTFTRVEGEVATVEKMFAEQARIYFQRECYQVGIEKAIQEVTRRAESHTWTPEKIGASKAGDMAYVYGTHRIDGTALTGNFLRIWEKTGDGQWKVTIQVVNTVPGKK